MEASDRTEDGTKYILRRMRFCIKSDIIRFDRVFGPREGERRIVALFYCKCEDKKRFWAEFW